MTQFLITSLVLFNILTSNVFANNGVAKMNKVGNDNVGYVHLPDTWMLFHSTSGTPSDLAYSDGGTIFTLSFFQEKGITENSLAVSIMDKFHRLGVQNVEGAKIKFAGYDNTYQIYGDFNNLNSKIVSYVFRTKNHINVLTFEGPENYLYDNLEYAGTFTIDK